MGLKRVSFDEHGAGCLYHPKGCVHPSEDPLAKFTSSLTNRRQLLHAPALDIDHPTVLETIADAAWRVRITGPRPKRRAWNALIDTLVLTGLSNDVLWSDLRREGHPQNLREPLGTLYFSVPVELVASSTPGHFHLYIEKEMSWSSYEHLLRVLRDAGVIGRNFWAMCVEWRCSFLLKPGIKKSDMRVALKS